VKEKRLQDLQYKEFIYQSILEKITDGVRVVDNNGKTIVYNQAIGRMESLEPDLVLNHSHLESLPDLTPETSTILTALRTGEEIKDLPQTYYNARGKKISTVNSTFPIQYEGEILAALEISRDITSVKELTDKVYHLQKELLKVEKAKSNNTRFTFADIIGKSEEIKKIIDYAQRAARSSSSVLIVGETGTGKELFAQGIHNASPRREKPFIAQNCVALPETLLEGLLFGTVKGAFTGAVDRAGLFEQANGGTILLDEINSMSIELQAKLLRVLQDGSIRRVGGEEEIKVDVRVLAAVNMDPLQSIEEKKLREDLYYRLSVVTLFIPPLRERKDDILLLVSEFINKYNKILQLGVESISSEVSYLFHQHNWPGNVRELEHVIEGAMNMIVEEKELFLHHLPPSFQYNLHKLSLTLPPRKRDGTINLVQEVESFEKKIIGRYLVQTKGNVAKAASMLGITRQVLQYKIKKYQLDIKTDIKKGVEEDDLY